MIIIRSILKIFYYLKNENAIDNVNKIKNIYQREFQEYVQIKKGLEKEIAQLQLEIASGKNDCELTFEQMTRELEEGLLMRVDILNQNETLKKELQIKSEIYALVFILIM